MRAWYGGIFGGLLPILLLGFLYSAIADRTAFALWAVAVGAFWVLMLREGIVRGWPPARWISSVALVLGLGLNWLGVLEQHHHEILDLGFRAVLPSIYRPALTNSEVAYILSLVAVVVCLVFLFIDWRGRKASPPAEESNESQA